LPFAAAVLFSLLGVILGFDGVARLKEREAPPFETGLYKAIWEIPPPPTKLVLFLDSMTGRWSVWAAIVLGPGAAWAALMRRDRPMAGLMVTGVWSAIAGLMGIWLWAFSLFVPKL
jgi:hypothetical protein